MACAGTEFMLSSTGQFDDWQQGIDPVHATVSGKLTIQMSFHEKDVLDLNIV
jgi:hypothetical protein